MIFWKFICNIFLLFKIFIGDSKTENVLLKCYVLQSTSHFIIFTEPTYQNPPGTLYYPSNQQDSRAQAIIYPSYAPPNLGLPIHPGYHVEITPQPPPHTAAPTSTTAQQTVSGGLENSNIAIHFKTKDSMPKFVQQVPQQSQQQPPQHPQSSSHPQHRLLIFKFLSSFFFLHN